MAHLTVVPDLKAPTCWSHICRCRHMAFAHAGVESKRTMIGRCRGSVLTERGIEPCRCDGFEFPIGAE